MVSADLRFSVVFPLSSPLHAMGPVRRHRLALLAAALALSACARAAGPVAVDASPAALGGFLAGAAGQSMGEEARARAFEAQTTAVASGTAAEWRASAATYGTVEPGPAYTDSGGHCRRYTHAATIDGRVQTGSGRACRSTDGTWTVVE
jgi:surface antigen